MKTLFVSLVVLLFIAHSFANLATGEELGQANPCTNFTSCSDCTANPQCGWCGPVQQCFEGTRVGPNLPQKCYGDSWFYGASCPNCTALKDCKSCLYMDKDCAWCGSDNTCIEWGSKLGCQPMDSCPCNVYGTCSDCIKDNGCKWCNGTCLQGNDPSCTFPAHSCPCSDNFDCDSCFADASAGCIWCEEQGSLGFCAPGETKCFIAHNCNNYCTSVAQSCSQCNQVPGCGWCPESKTCVDASLSTCFLQHTCPQCQHHKYCDPCQDDGCVWCTNQEHTTGLCRSPNDASDCFIQHTCDSYCQGYDSCTKCSGVPGCGWCDESKTCVDSDKSTCFLVHSCTEEEKCGFNGGAFVGGMFLGIGLVAIGIGGYLFYRYKVGGGRGTYRELH